MGHVTQFSVHISVQKRLITFSTAPKDEIFRFQFLGYLKIFLQLSTSVRQDVSVRVRTSSIRVPEMLSILLIRYQFEINTRLGLENRLQVAQSSLTPVFCCSSNAKSAISSKMRLDSSSDFPSGAMSLKNIYRPFHGQKFGASDNSEGPLSLRHRKLKHEPHRYKRREFKFFATVKTSTHLSWNE